MELLVSIFSGVIVVLSLIFFIWTIIGLPIGVVLVIIYLNSKEVEKKSRYKKWIKLCFRGILGLVIIFILWFIFQLILTLLGINSMPIPQQHILVPS
jgi:hypothetical protein